MTTITIKNKPFEELKENFLKIINDLPQNYTIKIEVNTNDDLDFRKLRDDEITPEIAELAEEARNTKKENLIRI